MAMLFPIHNEADASLLSDEELERYGTVFIALNRQYSLTDKHNYSFADFLACPNDELHIHRYFANRHLFISRKHGLAILLKTFLSDPESIFEAVLNVESAIAEAEWMGSEHVPLLDRQTTVQARLDAEDISELPPKFEKHHLVVMRQTLVEPIYRLHKHERKRNKR